VAFTFWQYAEAGNSPEKVKIEPVQNSTASVTLPANAKAGDTFHIIVEGKDNGTPELIRYQRVILEIK